MAQRKEFLKLTPSEKQSVLSGGTSHMLPMERKKATFDVKELINYLNGGAEYTKKRKWLENALSKDLHEKYNASRGDLLKEHVKDFVGIHTMAEISIGYGSLNNSHSIFMLTIIGQGSGEQHAYWIPKILKFEVTGTYAQTELGNYIFLIF
jgi:hypothetical protein